MARYRAKGHHQTLDERRVHDRKVSDKKGRRQRVYCPVCLTPCVDDESYKKHYKEKHAQRST